ncbi:MAG TPA: hypothetical protein VFU72_12265, partial [Nitrolancea sp.]|nr:hypothetical protein [Nitrolancea sp.]
RRRLAEALAHAFRAVDRPLLLVLDDLQWTDRETIEWLRYLFHHEADMCLLVVGTARPEELRSDPLAALTRELGNSDQFTQIALGPLDSHETSTLAADIAGDALAADQATTIYRETEGNPLFIVETVRAGVPVARGSQESPSGSVPLPPKISAVIAARLAQLSSPARELAALAATIGRAFSLEVLLGASPEDDETVVAALDELCARHIVRERGQDVYDFSHDKLRDVAYAEISAARRQLLHRRVARAIETVQAHNLEAVSAQLAAHYRQGGLPVEAIRFYELAGERSLRLSAYQDGIAHIQQALELLAGLPASQAHAQQEARLQTALGVALMATKGWPTAEVGEAYGRARALYQPGGDTLDRARLIWGLWGFHIVRGELATARELGERERALAEARNDPNLLLVSGIHLGTSLYHLGDLATARTLLEQAIALYDPEQHRAHASRFGPDLGVFGLAYLSHVLWQLGYPDRALARSRESIALARARAHPYSVAIALDYAAMLAQFRRDRAEVRALADEAIGLSRKQEFAYYLAWGEFLRAWSLDTRSRLAAMREALAALRATGAGLRGTYYFTLLAQAYLEAGQPGDGLNALTEAWDQQREHDERYWEPELHRTQAEILLAQGAPAHVVEQHLQDALASAKSQGAVSLELRAAASLGRLWRDRGMGTEAHELLTALVCRVSEGLDTPDLVETRALLRQIIS